MQIDRRFIVSGSEEENFQRDTPAGIVNFPIWIDEPVVELDPPVLSQGKGQAGIPDKAMLPVEYEDTVPEERIYRIEAVTQRGLLKGYTDSNPVTPVPARASASPSSGLRMRHGHLRSYTKDVTTEDVTYVPTMPQATIWPYEIPDVGVGISSLSQEMPVADRSRSIDELDTLPPGKGRQRDEVHPVRDYARLHPDISELATKPPLASLEVAQKLRDEYYVAPSYIDDVVGADTVLSSSITFKPLVQEESGALLSDAGNDLLVEAGIRRRGKRQEYRPSFALHPVDRIRWWLLSPGRLERLLWIVCTAILTTITCTLVFMLIIGLGIVNIGHSGSTRSTSILTAQCSGAVAPDCDSSTASSPAGLKIVLLNTTALLTSTTVHLRGQGFSVRGRVTLLYDNNLPCHPGTVQTDAHGEFMVDLTLGGKSTLSPGRHRLIVYDETRKQAVSLNILFT